MVSKEQVSKVQTGPYPLAPVSHEKVWGSTQLEPWFPNTPNKTGEVWFWEEGSSVLIKFLFTTESLSVQVHPNDTQARELENRPAGKTEMWHILKAEPGAQLAMGLTRTCGADELRARSEDGSIMELLRSVPAVPGETWFIPAGTIHAIGAGIALAEIQQYSDVTYRLYDYGRPRELHLDKGVAVSDTSSKPEKCAGAVCCDYFQTRAVKVDAEITATAGLVIVMRGEGFLGDRAVRAGEVWRTPEAAVLRGRGLEAMLVEVR